MKRRFFALLAVPVAFVSPLAAELMWAATIVLRGPLRGLAARLLG